MDRLPNQIIFKLNARENFCQFEISKKLPDAVCVFCQLKKKPLNIDHVPSKASPCLKKNYIMTQFVETKPDIISYLRNLLLSGQALKTIVLIRDKDCRNNSPIAHQKQW